MPLPLSMLRRLRAARRAQLGLWLAALLSVGGSLGLHPEPGDAALRSAGIATAPAERSFREQVPARHVCLACLSHRPISVSSAVAVPTARVREVAYAPLPSAGRPQRLDHSNHEGRAPPAAL